MAKFLIVAEQREGALKKASFECISEAVRLGAETDAVVIGSGIGDLADNLAHYGATKVYLADHADLANYSAEGYAKVVADLAKDKGFDAILMPCTSMGRDLAPRIAAKLEAGLCSDITELMMEGDKLLIKRPMYAGKVFGNFKVKSAIQMATLRPNVFAAAEPDTSKKADVETIDTAPGDIRAIVKEFAATTSEMVELTEANIIVAGGRGMKGPENFKMLEDLAKVLGGAVGASRAAVDAGWVPHAIQVGQTGKVVSPTLYIALGISGAIQHLAGMNSSKVIVAINKDPEAPIFQVADYGIVADLFEALPPLTEEFKKLLA